MKDDIQDPPKLESLWANLGGAGLSRLVVCVPLQKDALTARMACRRLTPTASFTKARQDEHVFPMDHARPGSGPGPLESPAGFRLATDRLLDLRHVGSVQAQRRRLYGSRSGWHHLHRPGRAD